ncbi:MAG TPA: sulfatase [Fimbriimonadaceae bacterium]|nr:sulfatase [Fimbriimonadaceae bacterium]
MLSAALFAAVVASPPNIVLILIDDMGWTDVGVYGSKYYETPNIDHLAETGVMFTQGYAACAVCSPTRYSIVTGKYPARSGITDWLRPLEGTPFDQAAIRSKPPYEGGKNQPLLTPTLASWMEKSETTIAEVLKKQGYATGFIGKWHLGPVGYWPENQGFDWNLGGCSFGHPPDYFDPYPAKHQAVTFPNLAPRKEGEYLTDRLTDEAVGFIERNKDRPFFLELAHYAVHAPIEAKADLIAKYRNKPTTNQKVPAYAAMVESVDDSVGAIVHTLERLGLRENTLLVFTSDNGGAVHFAATSNLPLRLGKGYPYEGGIREPFIVSWPDQIPAGQVSNSAICSIDLFPTFAAAANANYTNKVDGVDLLPLMEHGTPLKKRFLTWHYPHYWAGLVQPYSIIRSGPFKLIHLYEGDRYELYDVASDISESHDLSNERPDLVNYLKARLASELKAQGARFPIKNPDFHPGGS